MRPTDDVQPAAEAIDASDTSDPVEPRRASVDGGREAADEGEDRRAAEAEALLDALSPAQRVQFAQLYERWRYVDHDVRAGFMANAENEDLSDFAARVAILADLMGWMDDATITRYCASRMGRSDYLPEWVRARVPVLSPGTLKKWKEAFRTGTLHEIGQGHASLRRITKRPKWWPWDRRY